MNNTYQFYAISRARHAPISFNLIMLGSLLFVGLIVCMIIFLPKDKDVVKYFTATIIVFIAVYPFIMAKILNKLTIERWSFCFNGTTIEISSNISAKKTYSLLRLTLVELFDDKAPLGQSLGIRIAFTKVEGDAIAFTDELYLEQTILTFSGITKKNNFAVFKQFLDDLNKYILQPDFKLIDAKTQRFIRLAQFRYRQPAKLCYFRKDTDILFSKET